MDVSWDLIRSFLAVAETGSLSAAARRLGLTQPTVGRHIDLLEAALATPLFLRGRAGMRPTGSGTDLVASAGRMAATADEFQRIAAGRQVDLAGTLRIAANEIFGVMILPRLLAGFMDAHPGIQVELAVSNEAANLLQRDADIALRLFRPRQSDLVARKLADLPLGLYAHRDYLARRGRPGTLDDLRRHVFVGFDRETSLTEAARALGADLGRKDFAFRCDSILAHVEAIRGGLGIGVTHRGLAAAWPGVEPVLAELPIPPLELWIACHADLRHNPRVRLAMDHFSAALRAPYAALSRRS